MEFYKTRDIPTPSCMIKHQEHMACNKNSIVSEYVEEHLCVVSGAKLRIHDILNDFRGVRITYTTIHHNIIPHYE